MQWNDEIVGLWPTPVLRDSIRDPSLLDALVQLGTSTEPADTENLFSIEDPAVQRVRESIDAAAEAYFRHLGITPSPGWTVRGRLEALQYGESRGLRNLPGAYLSGIFYIQTPKKNESLKLRKDAFPGFLTMFDPRPGINMLSIKNDPYREQAMMAEPQPGLFLAWPAFVSIYRHPNLSREPQMCITFDVIPDDSDSESRAETPPWSGEISDLWPTGLIKRRLPQYERPNRDLIELIDELERANPDLTTDFNNDPFRDSTHPAVSWLKSHIGQSIREYFRQMGMTYPISVEIRAWPNVNRFGDYHSPHNHPWSYLSGTYYVQVPDPEIHQESEDVLHPACISYYDPRSGVNPFALPPESRSSRVYTIRPVPGALLMWPSAIFHFVHPNLSTLKRYSISFNVHIQWQDRYQ